ncbi:SPP1 family phage portal protein [Staphylococcus microti]|uniref:SPP1 family phage portal protein n=1 Tax=Staphylococcus microti TaxID=569857 RepID=A0A380GU26_9STAP|nr:phage portal protein [Staphylococcus microti]PNZ82467.1 phage portal protein [Staphylococcus microti]PNZ83652.1 phage portal protein [Staphylococcus microti]SUM57047.1 SPP1 family phage portal protein [Staphylococcus microti]
MYPAEPTETEKMLDFIKPKYETMPEYIDRLIREHTVDLDDLSLGEKYYNHHPDILSEEAPKDATGTVDPLKPDNRLFVPYHRILVDQKVGYAIGNPVTIYHESDKITELIHDTLTDDFDDRLIDILTAASNKGIEWLHVYVDEEGMLSTMRVPVEQSIPIYKNKERTELVEFIRVYMHEGVKRVEHWTPEDVTYYMYHEGQLVFDFYNGEENPTTHLDNYSWGRIPFIPFKNNTEETSDVLAIKTLEDAYNRRLSDLQNTFDESVESVDVLTNYESEDLSDYKRKKRYYKAIKVDDEGGIDTLTHEIPVDSSERYLNMLHEKIIFAAQAVDFDNDKFGNSPSGIALKFLYSNLDLKVRKLVRKTQVALRELMWFIYEHHNIQGDYKDVSIEFKFNRMTNELEQTQIASMSQTLLSEETLVSNHPWVIDPTAELERIHLNGVDVNAEGNI